MWPDSMSGVTVGGSPLLSNLNWGEPKAMFGSAGSSILDTNSAVRLPLESVPGTDGSGGNSWWNGLFGDATKQGQFGNIMGGLNAAGKLYLGMQQYGLAKDQLAQSKEQYAKNYAAQKSMTNSALSDRQNSRNAAGPGYQDTAGYMAQYGIA